MDVTKILNNVLAAIDELVRDFINLLLSPRAYARNAGLFSTSRFPAALSFLGISLFVTLLIKTPVFAKKPDPFPFLLADATWKLAFVLLETSGITIGWRLVGGRGGFGNYFVANCYYFGVLTIIGNVAVVFIVALIEMKPPIDTLIIPLQTLIIIVEVVLAVLVAIWGFFCWQAYCDYNKAGSIKRIVTLVICALFSIPSFFVGGMLWYSFVDMFFPIPL